MLSTSFRVSATSIIASSGVTGYQIAGEIGAVIAAIVALAGLASAIRINNRNQRREREQELRAEYERGVRETAAQMQPRIDDARRDADEAKKDAADWESRAWRDRP